MGTSAETWVEAVAIFSKVQSWSDLSTLKPRPTQLRGLGRKDRSQVLEQLDAVHLGAEIFIFNGRNDKGFLSPSDIAARTHEAEIWGRYARWMLERSTQLPAGAGFKKPKRLLGRAQFQQQVERIPHRYDGQILAEFDGIQFIKYMRSITHSKRFAVTLPVLVNAHRSAIMHRHWQMHSQVA